MACVFLNLNSTLDSGYITQSYGMNFFLKFVKLKKKDLVYITESFGVTGGLGAKPPTRGERSEP